MAAKNSGPYWHCHHELLFEWVYDYKERVRYIKSDKPQNEQATRLKWFTPIKGKLLPDLHKAGAAYGKARAAYDKAGAAYDKARAAYDKARAAFDKARAAYDKAGAAYDKAGAAYDKAGAAAKPAMEKLHAKEHPGCPWDGKTIFPQAK